MEILITNDDGIKAPGIHILAGIMQQLGHVTVVAPDGPRSGQSSALTVNSPLRLRKKEETSSLTVYVCNGTPADCIKLALDQLYDAKNKPDLVATGINHGSNSAISVIYSGTMGAAMEGCVCGILSIGFSLCNHAMEADFSYFEAYILQLTKQILAMDVPYGTCFNVNAPCGELKGIRVARQCKGKWIKEFEKRTDPHGRDYYWMTGEFLNAEADAVDTDEAWLSQGYITVVPVKIDMTDYDWLVKMKSLEI